VGRAWGKTGQQLVRQSGCLTTGSPDSLPLRGATAAAAAAGVPVVELSHQELVARQPQYAGLAPGDVAVWDPGAGICYPERNVRAQTEAARRLGADVYPHTMVTGIEPGRDGVTVRTRTAEWRAGQVVVAAGAWLGTLVPGLPLAPRRTPLYWFRPRDPHSDEFTLDRFPAFIWERPNGEILWGHGSADADPMLAPAGARSAVAGGRSACAPMPVTLLPRRAGRLHRRPSPLAPLTLAQPQWHAHERVDVVGQADAMISISYVCTRFLIGHEHR
jgi:glycine/D-amino acid oxidase-like deaminating enzyme